MESSRMIGELVSAQTADGVTLHGLLSRAADCHPKVDLIIYVHGVGSNFYQSSLLRKTHSRFAELGIAILSVNTRGHDFVFSGGMSQSRSWLGSANELVEECQLDLEAWIQKAVKFGFKNVLLAGHSLGAIKVIYSQANSPSSALRACVAISPSCLSCSAFRESQRATEFEKCLRWAEESIAQGTSNQIEEVTFPFKLMMSPQTFYDKYGPEEKYNILSFLDRVPLPLLLTFGELEVAGDNPAFYRLDQRALPIVEAAQNLTMQVIPDADHYYSGVQVDLATTIIKWIDQL